jgi:hypothetical protein
VLKPKLGEVVVFWDFFVCNLRMPLVKFVSELMDAFYV